MSLRQQHGGFDGSCGGQQGGKWRSPCFSSQKEDATSWLGIASVGVIDGVIHLGAACAGQLSLVVAGGGRSRRGGSKDDGGGGGGGHGGDGGGTTTTATIGRCPSSPSVSVVSREDCWGGEGSIVHVQTLISPFSPAGMSDANPWSSSPSRSRPDPIWRLPPKSKAEGRRPYLADKKRPFEHLRAKEIVKSTIRIAFVQCGSAFTTYLHDQLEMEMTREEKVSQGKLTPKEADRESEEWEKREWEARKKTIPARVVRALLKYHAATLIMRLLEYVALHYLFAENLRSVDKLTKDPHQSALRKFDRVGGKQNATREERIQVGKQMFHTSLRANAIAFLADYLVQEIILTWGYGAYYYKTKLSSAQQQGSTRVEKPYPSPSANKKLDDGDGNGDGDGGEDPKHPHGTVENGGLFLSYVFKSSTLFVSRATAWVVSSGGASVGTAIYPGWGTVLGTQVGDGLVGAVLDSD